MIFDLIIVGGSAAATSAGIYAVRRNINFKIICKDFGGEVSTSGEIGNWPGDGNTDGITLSQKFKDHLKLYGVVPTEEVEVERITKQEDGLFCITTKPDGEKMAMDKLGELPDGKPKCDFLAKTVIIATGVHPRSLSIPGEKEFRNKGLSYCTTCDGPLFGGKVVATIGGGNAALESGLMLSDIASKVYIINKNAQFKGEKVLIDNLQKKSNVEIIYNVLTSEIFGDKFTTGLKYKTQDGNTQELKVDGIFVHIGQVPNSNLAPNSVQKDQFGQIIVNQKCETNIPGLYAAGDVTNIPFKQIVIASAQGCISTLSAVEYLNRIT